MSTRRGTTFVEMVVYAAMLVVLVGVSGVVLGQTNGQTQRKALVARAQQSVTAGLHRIAREAREAPRSGVHLLDDGLGKGWQSTLGVVLASPRKLNGSEIQLDRDGHPAWRKWIAYYADGRRLYRAELPLSRVDVPPTYAQVLARSRVLITDNLVGSGLQAAYDRPTTTQVGGADPVLMTPHTASGGVITFNAGGFVVRWVTDETYQDDDGNTYNGSRKRLLVGVTAAVGGIGTEKASGGARVGAGNVFSSYTEAWVHHQ